MTGPILSRGMSCCAVLCLVLGAAAAFTAENEASAPGKLIVGIATGHTGRQYFMDHITSLRGIGVAGVVSPP